MEFIDIFETNTVIEFDSFYDIIISPFAYNKIVPAMHDDLKRVPGTDHFEKKEVGPTAKEFIEYMKNRLLPGIKMYFEKEHNLLWPLTGPLFIYAEIYLKPSEYMSNKDRRKDVDNLAKTLLDSMKEFVYHDDSQIKSLLIVKHPNPKHQTFLIALKCLRSDYENILPIPSPYKSITKSGL